MGRYSFQKPLALLVTSGVAISGLTMGFGQVAQAKSNVVTTALPQISSLDPTQWAAQILVDQGTILEGLYGYNQQNQVVPKIASGYKISNGGKTWTFTLRKNAKWSNGDPVTANDFYYSWMRQLAPSDTNAQLWASVLNNVKNSYAYHAGTVPASAVGLKVINKYTLQITTTVPHDILGELVLSASMPLDQKAVNAHPTDWYMPNHFVGNGPYVVSKFTPNGELQLTRNPKYVGAKGEKNYGNATQINIIPATTVPVEDFMSGKQDVALIGSTSDLKYINTHANLKSQLKSAAQYSITYLQYDNSATPSPLNNLKVRQAVELAIQRNPIVNQVLSGMGGATTTFSTPGWATAKYEKGLPTNVAKAKALLAQAGYPNGKGIPTLTMYCEVQSVQQQGIPVAEAIAQELKQELGINFNIVPLAATQYGALTYGGPQNNIKPGFNIAVGATNWSEPASLDMGATQGVFWPGDYGYSNAFVQHVFSWYNQPYDPASVKKFGNPTNDKTGVSWSDWTGLQNEAKKDIAWLDAWYAKQPQPYRNEVKPLIPLSAQWNQLVLTWKHATSNATKHAAWVQAFKFVAPYSAGETSGSIDLNSLEVQKYIDQHAPKQVQNWIMWQKEYQNSTDNNQAAKLAGKLVTQLMQQGYAIPLYYNKAYYLERSNVTGAQVNPWAWGNFYEFQYLSKK